LQQPPFSSTTISHLPAIRLTALSSQREREREREKEIPLLALLHATSSSRSDCAFRRKFSTRTRERRIYGRSIASHLSLCLRPPALDRRIPDLALARSQRACWYHFSSLARSCAAAAAAGIPFTPTSPNEAPVSSPLSRPRRPRTGQTVILNED
ncbi:hypothetical protein H104_03134, partial [Trichophyton rubrum CBS 289.86]